MKVYLIYDVGPIERHHKLAITLPSKWLEQSSDKVKECFVERYNKKFPDTPLDDEELAEICRETATDDLAEVLVQKALEAGTEDNVTVVVVAAGD